MKCKTAVAALLWSGAALAQTAKYPAPNEFDFVLHDFHFRNGERMAQVKLHYATLGKSNGQNGVLILHGTGGSGKQFLSDQFGGVLFGSGGLLDATKYFIILPDCIGTGHSSKPSDGLEDKFPHYGYEDQVAAQYRLITEGLGFEHLRLVLGTSMGGMQTWLWGERYPQFTDALMPLASLPWEISGRNRFFRRMIIDPLKNDPVNGYRVANYTLVIMTTSPLQLQKEAPSRKAADRLFDQLVERRMGQSTRFDMLYQFESSEDYNPAPDLEKITAPLLAVNSADDQVNPPEVGVMEREIRRVKHGRFVLLPITDGTRGHGTHSMPTIWGSYLSELLAGSVRK